MKHLLTILSIILVLSCTKDNVINLEDYGFITFNGTYPTQSSKIPNCKTSTPTSITFRLSDIRGKSWTETSDIVINNGNIESTGTNQLPVGLYTVNEVYLTDRDNVPIYSIPNENELQFEPFWNTTVPFNVEIGQDTTTLSGSMFCFTPTIIDDTSTIASNLNFNKLQSMWFELRSECIDQITIEVDAYRILEVYPFEMGRYELLVPQQYTLMTLRAYDGNTLIQSIQFNNDNPYNADGIMDVNDLLIIDPMCN